MRINGVPENATANLAVGENFIKVRVTSPDDSTVQDYNIKVTREAFEASDDATLGEIYSSLLS